MVDIERAKLSPSEYFGSPKDVVDHKELTRAQKVEILERWRYDALLLETAQSENMQAEKRSRLSEVLNALHELGVER